MEPPYLHCLKCKSRICEISSLCQYSNDPSKPLVLTLRPELCKKVLKQDFSPPAHRIDGCSFFGLDKSTLLSFDVGFGADAHRKKHNNCALCDIICKACQGVLGKLMNYDTKIGLMPAFGKDDVTLDAKTRSSLETFDRASVMRLYSGVVVLKDTEPTEPLIRPSLEHLQKTRLWSLVNSEPRNYQIELFCQAFASSNQNALICLPTGAGKTLIAAMVAALCHQFNAKERLVLFVAPKVALVNQQAAYLEEQTGKKVVTATGDNTDNDLCNRIVERENVEIVVATPATILERIPSRFRLDRFSCIIIDEAHETIGGHPYMSLMKLWKEIRPDARPFVLALTASPSRRQSFLEVKEDIRSLSQTLGSARILNPQNFTDIISAQPRYERLHVSKPAEDDAVGHIILSIVQQLHPTLRDITQQNLKAPSFGCLLKKLRFDERDLSRKDIIKLCRRLLISLDDVGFPSIIPELQSVLLSVNTSLPDAARMQEQLESIQTRIHPRLESLVRLISQSFDVDFFDPRALVFVQHRLSASLLADALRQMMPSISVGFVTGRCKGGTVDEERESILASFKAGEIDVVVATSVLEEGIDVPDCNLVIRMSRATDIKALLQSRGRARSPDASARCVLIEDAYGDAFNRLQPEIAQANLTMALQELAEPLSREVQDLAREAFSKSSSIQASCFIHSRDDKALGDDKLREILARDCCADLSDIRITSSKIFGFSQRRLKLKAHVPTVRELQERIVSVFGGSYWLRFDQAKEIDDNLSHLAAIQFGRLKSQHHFSEISRIAQVNASLKITKENIIAQWSNTRITVLAASIDRMLLADVSSSQERPSIRALILPLLEAPVIEFVSDSSPKRLPWPFSVVDCPFIRFEFASPKKVSFASQLQSFMGLSCFIADIETRKYEEKEEAGAHGDISADSEHLVHMLAAAPIANLSLSHVPIEDIFALFGTVNQEQQIRTAQKVLQEATVTPFELFKLSASPTESELSDLLLVRCADITPAGVIPRLHTPIMANRVLTKFGPHHFIVTKFCDSNGSSLPHITKGDYLAQWMKRIIIEGFSIGRTKYAFVGCSSSQLREGGAWFVAVGDLHPSPTEIWAWMGDFSSIKSVAKLLARMGLFFSSGTPTFDVPDEKLFQNAADIERFGFCFTDGAGTISPAAAKGLARLLCLSSVPSAFQIRIAGCKGVLAVDYSMTEDLLVSCTKSMTKMDSPHRNLNILDFSKYQQAYLNQQFVLMLSARGVPDSVIEKLFHDHLAHLELLLSTGESSELLTELKSVLPIKPDVYCDKEWVCRDAWHLQLARTVVSQQIRDLRDKLRVRVPDGSMLMGIPDIRNILQPNQVFCQVSNEDGSTRVISGPVLVAKNPTLWPGDGQLLEAVDCHQLRDIRDCIVFSTQGDRPVPNKCAGSDLDGDLYTVIWDQNIVQNIRNQVNPIDFPSNEAAADFVPTSPWLPQLAEQFLSNACNSTTLGAIANAHIVVCDRDGLLSEDSKTLALEFSKAVDFPKTGIPGLVPEHIKIDEYPHFMGKEPSYESKSLLGRMYTLCAALLPSNTNGMTELASPTVDQRIIDCLRDYCSQSSADESRVEELKKKYDEQLSFLMRLYGVESEAELLSGIIVHPHLTNLRHSKLIRQLQLQLRELVTTFRGHLFGSASPLTRAQLASWCYIVTIDEKRSIQSDDVRLISFPWIVAGHELKAALASATKHVQGQIQSSISVSLTKFFESNAMSKSQTQASTAANLGMTKRLAKVLKVPVAVFGSRALMLQGPSSDIDFAAPGIPFDTGRDILREDFGSENVRQISGRPALEVIRGNIKFDVSFGREGVCKTLWAQKWLASDSGKIWHAARLLCDWARSESIIANISAGYMPLIGFLILLHEYVSGGQHADCQYDTVSPLEPSKLIKLLEDRSNRLVDIATHASTDRSLTPVVVRLVIGFLEHLSLFKGKLRRRDPLVHVEEDIVHLTADQTQELSNAARRALIKVKVTATFSSLLLSESGTYSMSKQFYIAPLVSSESVRQQLEQLSGCQVTFEDLNSGFTRVTATAPRNRAFNVPLVFWHMRRTLRDFSITRATTRVFIKGSGCLLFSNAESLDEFIRFEPYPSTLPRNLQHKHIPARLTRLSRRVSDPNELNLRIAYEKYMWRIFRQMSHLARTYDPRFGRLSATISFGVPYVLGEPSRLSLSVEDLEKNSEVGKSRLRMNLMATDAYSSSVSKPAPDRTKLINSLAEKKSKKQESNKSASLRTSFFSIIPPQITEPQPFIHAFQLDSAGFRTEKIHSTHHYYQVPNMGQVEIRFREGRESEIKMKKRAIRWFCADLSTTDPYFGLRIKVQTQHSIEDQKSLMEATKVSDPYMTRLSDSVKWTEVGAKWDFLWAKIQSESHSKPVTEFTITRDMTQADFSSTIAIRELAESLWSHAMTCLRLGDWKVSDCSSS